MPATPGAAAVPDGSSAASSATPLQPGAQLSKLSGPASMDALEVQKQKGSTTKDEAIAIQDEALKVEEAEAKEAKSESHPQEEARSVSFAHEAQDTSHPGPHSFKTTRTQSETGRHSYKNHAETDRHS